MALFYKYIKGCAEPNEDTEYCYTYLDFAQSQEETGTFDPSTHNYLPIVKVYSSDSYDNSKSLGKMIVAGTSTTSGTTTTWYPTEQSLYNIKLYPSTNLFCIENQASQSTKFLCTNANSSTVIISPYQTKGDSTSNFAFQVQGSSNFTNSIKADSYQIIGTYLNVGGATSKTTTGDISAKNYYADASINAGTNFVTTSGYCQALYFNATSDKRAKEDIKPFLINALDIIQEVNLYTFKYKASHAPSIGILAQDVKDINIDGFSLVENAEATGENGDYMSIHESKLVYVLWKAIQEQQEEIQELKAQIQSLIK